MNQNKQPLLQRRGREQAADSGLIQQPVAPLPPYNEPSVGEPVIPLPPFVEPPMGEPVIPLPPFVEPPAGEPVVPLPPFVEPPAGEPVAPLPPIVEPPQRPVWPGSGVPPVVTLPPIVVPSQQPVFPGYCAVRFLHAAYGYEPVRVTIGPRIVCNELSYGGLTQYGRVPDGFYTVTVTSATSPRTLLYQSTIPFRAGNLITLAITRTSTGVDLTSISDAPCVNRPGNRACIRAINLCYGSPALDIVLDDGRVVFTDIHYKETTPFRLALPQQYGMYVAQTPYALSSAYTGIETLEDLPMVLSNLYLPGYGEVMPIASFYIDAKAGGMYTIYMLGMWSTPLSLRVRIVEDF